jgi:hypothetical protein
MNNSRSNVYRGDFRKSVKACEFTHVSVFMRTWRADSRFAAYRILRRFHTGNAGAYDLVCMPAKRDSGSLQCHEMKPTVNLVVIKQKGILN